MKVLVPVDGSQNINACLKRLGKRQWASGDSVHLISVVDLPTLTEEQAKEVISQALVHFRGRSVEVTSALVHGRAAVEILKTAELLHVDVICMGAQGKHGWRDAFVGSVAHDVAQHAKCTVVLYKSNPDGTERAVNKILVCVDKDNNMTDLVMSSVERSVSSRDMEVIVLNVIDLVDLVPGSSSENPTVDARLQQESIARRKQALETAFAATLDAFARRCTGSKISLRIEADVDIVETILNLAKTCVADLIVMGTHDRTGTNRCWLGSISEAVLKNAPCSVEIIRNPIWKA